MSTKAIPEGYQTATPYLTLRNLPAAIAFYEQAFGATEIMGLEMAPGVIAHAEIKIGNSILMMWRRKTPSGATWPPPLWAVRLCP